MKICVGDRYVGAALRVSRPSGNGQPSAGGKTLATVQSCYIPWKGYFDLINFADEFVLYDEAKFSRGTWRNRNLIKTPGGLLWLTIPVRVKSRSGQKISETLISDPRWNRKHWRSIVTYYSRAPHFPEYRAFFEELYLGCEERRLSEVNYRFISAICGLLGIGTRITRQADYRLSGGQTERLVQLCRQTGATEYLSGPTAGDYLEEDVFRAGNVILRYMDYSGYPEYRQLSPPFVHEVSVVDLILNEGSRAASFMKSLP